MMELATYVPLAPFAAFAVILLGGLLPKDRGFGAGVSTVVATLGTGVAFLLSLLVFASTWGGDGHAHVVAEAVWTSVPGASDLTLGILVDPLSALMAVIVGLVAFLVHVFSKGYMNDEDESGLTRYYAELALFTGSMLAFVFASNLLMAFMFFELVGLCSYLLIGFWYETPSAASAAKKAFLVTRFGDYFFLVGVVGVFAAFGSFAFTGDDAFPHIAEEMLAAGEPILGFAPQLGVTVLGLLVLGGVIGKSAQFPLHTWLPDAMEGPTTVSALIHAATMVAAGVYLVARLFGFYALSPTAMLIIALVGGFTALFAATMGVVMDDIKRVLAYSTISQYGYMMLALGAGGYTAGVFHLMNHAFFKALLFLGAGSVIVATHHHQDMWEFGGLKDRIPVTYWTFLAGSLALAGIVPFSGFWSKDEILTVAFTNAASEPLLWLAFAMGLVAVFFTGYYTFRMVALTFHGEPRSEHAEEAQMDRWSIKLPLLVLGALAAVVGFVNAVPLGIHALEHFLHPEALMELAAEQIGYAAELHVNYAVTGASLALAVAGAALGHRWFAAEPRALKEDWGGIATVLENKYYLNEAQVWLAESFTYGGVAWNLNVFDLDVVDGLVDAISAVSLGSGDAMRRIQDGVVSHYAAIITFGVVALVFVVGLVGGWI
jgi:NADH-quinone oxidoreductase subunit L